MSHDVRTFGKYLLDKEIARGGMARVHLARLRGLGGFEKRLVVKQILPELASDPRFVSMFVDEAKTVVQMSHPHIVPVYELGVVEGVYFLAMEYVEGATLAEVLRAGPLVAEAVAHVGAEICDALHYAHTSFSVVHRDVTPRNVIVDANGHSRLLDFGIAAPVTSEDAATFGTPGYLSPEQMNAASPGPRSDVFSLGAVLFEALAGARAYDVLDIESARAALGTAPDLAAIADDELRAIVGRALETDLEARWDSARALGRALRGWLASRAPEGIGPELAQRVQRASAERERLASGDFSLDDGLETPPAQTPARTLATSPLLANLLGPIEPPAEINAAEGPSTQAIEGRQSTPTPDPVDVSSGPSTRAIEARQTPDAAPHTAPIAGRRSEARDEPAPSPEDRDSDAPRTASAVVASRAPGPPTRRRLFGLGALAVAAFGVWRLWPAAGDAVEPTPIERPAVEPTQDVEPPPDLIATEPPPPVEPPVAPEPPPETHEPPPVVRSSTPLTVNAQPWGEVFVDGRSIGNTPQRRVALRAGAHTVEVRNPPLGRSARTRIEADGRAITILANLGVDPPTIRVR